MYPVRVLSLNNGWEKLIAERPAEWQDMKHVLDSITPEVIVNLGPRERKSALNLAYLGRFWEQSIKSLGWEPEAMKVSETRHFSLESVKNGVSSVLIGDDKAAGNPTFVRHLLITAPEAVDLGMCDIYVLLVQADDIADFFSSTKEMYKDFLFLESTCRAQLAGMRPISHNVPFVIIFFSKEFEEITVEELPTKQFIDLNALNKTIEFAPEYYQAGVGILSYFGEVLRKKAPDLNARISIEQLGNTVQMRIESPNGEIELIKEELEKYGLIIMGVAPPESLFANSIDVLELKNKLEMAQMEVKQKSDLLQLARDLHNQAVIDYKQEVSFLRQQIGVQLVQGNTLIQLVGQQISSSERVQMAQIEHHGIIFKDLLNEAQGNQVVVDALRSLEYNLMSGIAAIDVEDQINQSLTTIKSNKPNILKRIAEQIESIAYKAGAPIALEWIKVHIHQ